MTLIKATGGKLASSVLRMVNLASRDSVIVWLPVVGSLLVVFKILSNGFLYDDYVHLFEVTDLPFLDAIGHSENQHLLHSFKFVVWSIKSLFGAEPVAFFSVGLILHLISVRLLLEVIYRLTGNYLLAAVGAGFWGMGPFAAGSLAWISVHGQVYATSAILWILLEVVRISEASLVISKSLVLRHALLLMVAATSFGTGLAMAMALPFLVAFWLPKSAQRTRLLAVYGAIAAALLVLYLYTGGLQIQSSDTLARLFFAGFSGMLQQANALAELWSIGLSGLVLGPLMIGKYSLVQGAWLIPFAKGIALVFVLPLMLVAIVLADTVTRYRIFALLLLSAAAYELIALARAGGHLPFRPEALRYHYLPSAVIAIALCLASSRLAGLLPGNVVRPHRALIVLGLALTILPFHLSSLPAVRSINNVRQEERFRQAMMKIESAIANDRGQSEIYIPNGPFRAYAWKYTPKLFPGFAGLFIINYPENVVDGKRIYFLEESREVVEFYQARKGSRIAELLVHAPGLSAGDDTPGPAKPAPQ